MTPGQPPLTSRQRIRLLARISRRAHFIARVADSELIEGYLALTSAGWGYKLYALTAAAVPGSTRALEEAGPRIAIWQAIWWMTAGAIIAALLVDRRCARIAALLWGALLWSITAATLWWSGYLNAWDIQSTLNAGIAALVAARLYWLPHAKQRLLDDTEQLLNGRRHA